MYGQILICIALIASNINIKLCNAKSIQVQRSSRRSGSWIMDSATDSVLGGNDCDTFMSIKMLRDKPKYLDIYCKSGNQPILRNVAASVDNIESHLTNISDYINKLNDRIANVENLVFVGSATHGMNQRNIVRYLQRFNRRLKVTALLIANSVSFVWMTNYINYHIKTPNKR